jgi:hypothetical protein
MIKKPVIFMVILLCVFLYSVHGEVISGETTLNRGPNGCHYDDDYVGFDLSNQEIIYASPQCCNTQSALIDKIDVFIVDGALLVFSFDCSSESWGECVDLGLIDFDGLTEAPASGYSNIYFSFKEPGDHMVGHVICFKTQEGHYAKIQIIGNEESTGKYLLKFKWAYQTDGSRSFVDTNKNYGIFIGVHKPWSLESGSWMPQNPHGDAIGIKNALDRYMNFKIVNNVDMVMKLEYKEKSNFLKIKDSIQEVGNVMTPDDKFVFYYSGHGATDGKEVQALCVSEINQIWDSELESWLNTYIPTGAKKIVIIDSCYSGGLWEELNRSVNNLCFLASAAKDKKSARHPITGRNLYSNKLIAGLQGTPARADENGDGLTFKELHDWAFSQLLRSKQNFEGQELPVSDLYMPEGIFLWEEVTAQFAGEDIITETPNPGNSPPVADAGPDQLLYAEGGVAEVVLNGSGSIDPDDDPIVNYSWYVSGNIIASGSSPTIHLQKGEHVIDLIVNDGMIDSNADQVVITVAEPMIGLNRKKINFGAVFNDGNSIAQSFYINNTETGFLIWTLVLDQTWISCSPTSGIGSGTVSVSVNPSGLSPGTYSGTISVSDLNATNSPQTVNVILTVYANGQASPPFGTFETPMDGATVSSSIPVTGWVLDDIEVSSVKIYNGNTYVGDALFVEGARPDVETAYPDYPNNYQAGWGYMLLTNFLPNGGNGKYTLIAKARDIEGHEVTLGFKTITVDNANAVKPFGAIDTPSQGGTASGSSFVNWGWVLTPQPNSIPTDGSTIDVWLDGINLGHPTYNIYRSDIAKKFPGYANSNGAIGYFYLDTTTYANGVHTIQWTARDTSGNTDGIGSRYFTIQNTGADAKASGVRRQKSEDRIDLSGIETDNAEPVIIQKGFKEDGFEKEIYTNETGEYRIKIIELEPLRIKLDEGSSIVACYQLVGNHIRKMPAGMTIRDNTLSWMPGVAFLGNYRFVVVINDENGDLFKKFVNVLIQPNS